MRHTANQLQTYKRNVNLQIYTQTTVSKLAVKAKIMRHIPISKKALLPK